jgi:hypothetical protein
LLYQALKTAMIIFKSKFKSKHTLKRLLAVPLTVLLVAMTGCRIEREQAGEAPEVNVDVEPGQLPEYDIQGPDVNVQTTEQPVTVPEVDIDQREETIEVPTTIDIDPPGASPEQ